MKYINCATRNGDLTVNSGGTVQVYSEGIVTPISSKETVVTVSSTVDVNLTTLDSDKVYVYTGNGDVTFNLPSVSLTNIGSNFHLINATGYRLTVQAADIDTIDDSGEAATIYSGEPITYSSSSSSSESIGNSSSSSESIGNSSSSEDENIVDSFTSIKLMLCKPAWWHVIQGRVSWTTTEFV